MNLRYRYQRAGRCRRGFSLAEVIMATAISTMAGAICYSFLRISIPLTYDITEATNNTSAGSYVARIIDRKVREACKHEISVDGTQLTLYFDADLDVDSSNNGNKYDDADSSEIFLYDTEAKTIRHTKVEDGLTRVIAKNVYPLPTAVGNALFSVDVSLAKLIKIQYIISSDSNLVDTEKVVIIEKNMLRLN